MFKPKKNNEHEVFQYGFAAGKGVERERILALLDSPTLREEWIDATMNCIPTFSITVKFIQDLIRGEQ